MNKREIGNLFEDIACKHLIELGYLILERNFHASKIGEIDIIAIKDGQLYFVEVKGRRSVRFGAPAESVSPRKIQKIKLTASYYLTRYDYHNLEINFFILEILQSGEAYDINIISDIF